MNLPNKLTLLRIGLIPIFVISYYLLPPTSLWPMVIFILASVTDFFDGSIARKQHLVTTFGKFMDPLADKLLTQAAFILLVDRGLLAGWVVLVILARELMITAFRSLAASRGRTIAASSWGKAKTVSQMITLIYFLIMPAVAGWWSAPAFVSKLLIGVTLFLTLLSGFDYIWKNQAVLDLEHI